MVTGANGFVGQQLCTSLTKSNFALRAAVQDEKGLSHLPAGVKGIVTGDLGAITNWKFLLDGVNVIVHLAARVHQMKDNERDQERAYKKTNVAITYALANAASKVGVQRFVFISSVKAMGESTSSGEAWNESSPCTPQDAYGRSKLEAENILLDISRKTRMEVVILRLPLVYGPGVKANMARLFKLVNNGIPLPFGIINNLRSLLYIGNLVDALRVSIDHPAAAREIFLVSDGEDVSTPELVRRIAHALDRPERLLPFPPTLMRLLGRISGKSGEIERLLDSLVVDTGKIRRILSWKPPFTMEQGLKQTAYWYRSNEHTKRVGI